MTSESTAPAVMPVRASARRRSDGKVPYPPDPIGMLLLGIAVAVAPLEIWSLMAVGSHGVTLSHVIAVLLSILAVVRIRRMPLTAAFALYCLIALVIWGVIVAFLQSGAIPSLTRSARNALLLLLMFGAFAGASTIRVDLDRRKAGARIALGAYVLVILYAVYQAFARRMLWPLAYLRVTNPSYGTDSVYVHLQHGRTAAEQGWGEYFVRASATFAEPAHLGRYLVYGFVVGIALIALGGRHMRWGFAGVLLSLVGLIANYSLNGILSYAVVMAVMTPALLRQVRFAVVFRLAVLMVALVAGTFLIAPSIHRSIAERLETLSVAQSSGRFEALPLVWAEVKERPWGAGLGGVSFGDEIHNGYMLFVVQFGLLGAVVPVVWFCGMMSALLFVIRRARDIPPTSRTILLASAGFLAAQLAGWLGGSALHLAFAWIMSGVAFGTLGRTIGPGARGATRGRVSQSPVARERGSAA